ncbi:MAG: hypothetical protein H7329_19075, partial [Opitutaceae bacterium]|nr:hypothetical protein [Cytophagales bacterium]
MTAFKSAWEFCKANKMFLFALITIHAIYFFCALHFEGICNGDSDEYLLTAENLKYHGEVYNWVWKSKLDPFFYTLRPPLYGVFIFLLKLLWDNDYFVLFVQNLLSIGNWLLLIHLSRLLK